VARYETGEGSPWLKRGLMALAGLPLLCGGCGLMGFLYIRSESPYEAATERALAHAQVKKTLGEPVSADFLFKGRLHTTGDDGISTLEIGMSGSQQDGVLHVRGVRTSGVWGFNTLKLVAADGTVINVVGKY
jgi:hypothetical protein